VSEAVSRSHGDIDAETRRTAVDKLPDVTRANRTPTNQFDRLGRQ
jgi:hypothetical protein